MDGAGNALRDFENDSVRQEIGQFVDGRWQNCSAKHQKQGRPAGNQSIR